MLRLRINKLKRLQTLGANPVGGTDYQILQLYPCGLQVPIFKMDPQSKPCDVVAYSSNLSQFPIQVKCAHQSMANHWAAFSRNHKIIRNMKYSLIIFLPWLIDRAHDDTNLSIIFVSQRLERFVIRHDNYVA